MSTIIDNLRMILGTPGFIVNGQLQPDLFFEYFVASLLLVLVVSSVFKIVVGVFSR